MDEKQLLLDLTRGTMLPLNASDDLCSLKKKQEQN